MEAGAIQEQIAFDPAVAVELQRLHIAGLAGARDGLDPAFMPHDTACLGKVAQEARVEARVEVEGVGHFRQNARSACGAALHAARQRRDIVERIGSERLGHALGEPAQPGVAEGEQAIVPADIAECVHVAAALGPADEFDGELVGCLGCGDERILVDAEAGVEHPDLRDGRLADAHRADRIGFDERDGEAGAEEADQCSRGHPPGRSATGDDDTIWCCGCHGSPPPVPAVRPGLPQSEDRAADHQNLYVIPR